LQTDIYLKLEHDFGEALPQALSLLEDVEAQTKGNVDDRILRAMIYLSKGDVGRLEELIALVQKDYRDLLWQAEYDEQGQRQFDFSKTFHELNFIK
jgi:hypothetical protein